MSQKPSTREDLATNGTNHKSDSTRHQARHPADDFMEDEGEDMLNQFLAPET